MKVLLCWFFSLGIAYGKDHVYQVEKLAYEGYYLKKSKSAPTVFLIHDWDGLTEYEKKRSKMLFDLGYSVFSIDLFGKGIRPTEAKDKKQHTGELYRDRKKMRTLLQAALDEAKELGLNTKNAIGMGYCFGGAAVLEWARSGTPLKAFASFHGGLQTPEGQSYKDTKGTVLVFHGSADDHITLDHLAELGKELEGNKIEHELISYSGAPHAFTVFGSGRYHEKSDKKSWNRFTAFLNETLK